MYPGSSLVASNSTYHSFNDIELFEPPSPPKKNTVRGHRYSDSIDDERPMTAIKMQRQDSGYESYGPSPRSSTSTASSTTASPSRPCVRRKVSTASSGTGAMQHRKRPSTHRSAKSYPQSKQSLHHLRSAMPLQTQPISYFQFPSPEPVEPIELTENSSVMMDEAPVSPLSPPPQTTHYWTSDSTRRLEYAAIDAASRGFKGWVRRRLIPDCFVPQESKHVSFDDDTGSVRRYRLELEDDVQDEKKTCRRKPWQFWSSRKSAV